jgi:hypothetical protein
MSELPDVTTTTVDGALAVVDASAQQTIAILGVATEEQELITAVVAAGTTPPDVTLSGYPLESADLKIDIQTGGILETATFRWSKDNGVTWEESDIETAVDGVHELGDTGVTATFAAGTYNADNVYTATIAPLAVETYYESTSVIAARTSGLGVELVAAVCDEAPGTTVLFVPVPSDVAGTNSAVTKSRSAAPAVTLTGVPVDSGEGLVEILTEGARGVATFRYSLDLGKTWSRELLTAATYEIPGFGVTLNFAVGDYEASDLFSWVSTEPGFSDDAEAEGFAALRRDGRVPKAVVVVRTPTGGSDAARATASASHASTVSSLLTTMAAAKMPTFALVQAGQVTAAALGTAFDDFADRRLGVCVSWVRHTSSITRRKMKRPFLFAVAVVCAKFPISQDWAIVGSDAAPDDENATALSGRLPKSFTEIGHDERKSPGYAVNRFIVPRTWPGGIQGFFIANPNTMAAAGSDYEWAQRSLVMDEADRIVYRKLVVTVSSRTLNADAVTGRIDGAEAAALENSLASEVRRGMGQHFTAVKVVINRTDAILSTNTLRYKVKIQPFAHAKWIEATLSFYNPALAAAA